MASIKKAGIAFDVFVDTSKDILGKPSGFAGKIISNLDGSETPLATAFAEVIEVITAASTTLVGAHAIGARVLTVTSVSGFTLGDTILLDGNYYVITSIDTTNNILGIDRALVGASADAAPVDKKGNTGTYKSSVTIATPGDYVAFVSNYELGMGHTSYPLVVETANIDDVKSVLDAVKTEVDTIQNQVTVLDPTAMANIDSKVTTVNTTVTSIKSLIDDAQDVIITLNGDETATVPVGTNVTGDTSTATGLVTGVTYDATTTLTTVLVNNVVGKFVVGETLNNGTASTTGTIQTLVNDAVNNVIDFVKEISNALSTGGSSLAALKALNNDIEHMLKGDATLDDGTTNPLAGFGLDSIMSSVAAVKADTAAVRTLAEDAAYGFSAIRTAIDNGRNSIESQIAALSDTTNANSLASKIDAAKVVVDANSSALTDAGFGLSATKTALDNLAGLFATGGAVELRFTNLESYTQNLSTAIADQTTHIDGKFADVMNGLNSLGAKTSYTVFA